MRGVVVILPGVVALVAFGLAWKANHAACQARLARAELAQKAAETRSQTRRNEERITAAERDAALLRTELAQRPPADVATGSRERAPAETAAITPTTTREVRVAREAANDPHAQLARLAGRRAYQAMIHRPLFDSLRLSPAQIERYLDIRAKLDEVYHDTRALRDEDLVARDDPGVAKLRADAKAQADVACRELLGEEGFQRLREYDRSFNVRDSIMGFAGVATLEGCPLSPTQLEQLVQIVANADSDYRKGKTVGDLFNNIDWDTAAHQARPLMSETQWRLFTTVASSGSGYAMANSRLAVLLATAAKAEATGKASPP